MAASRFPIGAAKTQCQRDLRHLGDAPSDLSAPADKSLSINQDESPMAERGADQAAERGVAQVAERAVLMAVPSIEDIGKDTIAAIKMATKRDAAIAFLAQAIILTRHFGKTALQMEIENFCGDTKMDFLQDIVKVTTAPQNVPKDPADLLVGRIIDG